MENDIIIHAKYECTEQKGNSLELEEGNKYNNKFCVFIECFEEKKKCGIALSDKNTKDMIKVLTKILKIRKMNELKQLITK